MSSEISIREEDHEIHNVRSRILPPQTVQDLPPYPGRSRSSEGNILDSSCPEIFSLELIVGVVAPDVGNSIANCIDRITAEGFRITHLETRTATDGRGGYGVLCTVGSTVYCRSNGDHILTDKCLITPLAVDGKGFDIFFRLTPNVIDYLEKKTNKNKLQQSLLQIGFVGDVQVCTV